MKVNKQIIGKIKAFFFLLNIIVNSPQNVNEVLLTGDRISCFLTLCHWSTFEKEKSTYSNIAQEALSDDHPKPNLVKSGKTFGMQKYIYVVLKRICARTLWLNLFWCEKCKNNLVQTFLA